MAEATARQRPARPRRRSKLPFLLLVLGCLALLWGIYWHGAREIANAVIDRSLARAVQSGVDTECEAPVSGGFPLSLDFACTTTKLSSQAHGLSAGITGFSARAPLYWPGRVEMDYRGPLVFSASAPSIEAAAEWTDAGTVIDAGIGGLQSFSATTADLAVKLRHDIPELALTTLSTPEARLSLSPRRRTAPIVYRQPSKRRRWIHSMALSFPKSIFPWEPKLWTSVPYSARILAKPSATGLPGRQIQVEKLEIEDAGILLLGSGPLADFSRGLISAALTIRMSGLESLPEIVEAFVPAPATASRTLLPGSSPSPSPSKHQTVRRRKPRFSCATASSRSEYSRCGRDPADQILKPNWTRTSCRRRAAGRNPAPRSPGRPR